MKKIIILLFISLVSSQADHLLFKRITTDPMEAEMVIIYNPTTNGIDLSDYYISDAVRSASGDYYYNLPSGEHIWSGRITDFIARFPDGQLLQQGDSLILGLHTQTEFEDYYQSPADLTLFEDMRNALQDSVTISFGINFSDQDMLGNSSEILILFKWDGESTVVEDVDYFLWGSNYHAVDKTGIIEYLPDTPVADQEFLPIASEGFTYNRIDYNEGIEKNISGNGITGHDETSENLNDTWTLISVPGCMDPDAGNFNPYATIDDGSCTVSIVSILSGEYDDQYARVEGLIVDYFDITVFNGPHSLTIADDQHNELEISIWTESMTDSLFMLTNYPMAKYKVSVYGMIDLYPDANNTGICDEPDEDSDCSLPPSLWDCEAENIGFGNEIIELSRTVNDHCKWQLQLADASDLTIIDTLTVEYPMVEFSELLAFSSDVKASPWFHKNITIQGLLVDYVNITESCGPHVMTLEDTDHYRLEVITFDAKWSNSLSCLTLPPYGTQFITVKGYVGEYKNEIQISFDDEVSIQLLDSYSYDGDFYFGQGACFMDDGNYLESDKQNCEDLGYQWINTNKAKIIPVSYVIIPSFNERLDFSFVSPQGARTIVRIFDLSGRIITSLVDRYDQEAGVIVHNVQKTSWDGRDHLGQITAPGTYIIHLESINFTTGKTTTDIAPIVVGVKK